MRNRHVYSTLAVVAVCLMAGCAPRGRVPAEADKVVRHTVRDGETLEEIARDYYGSADRAADIARFNQVRGNAVSVGEVLRIPLAPEEMAELTRREKARAPYNEGLELTLRGSYLDAVMRFSEAIKLDDRFADAHFNLGVTYQRMKANDRALESFQRAVAIQSDNADYRYALGGAYFHEGRLDRAVDEFRQTLQIEPGHRKAQYSFALALEKSSRLKEARAEWQRYLTLDSTSEWAAEARSHLKSLGR